MTNFIDRLKLGITAFREGYLTSSAIDTDEWGAPDARRLRYDVLWAQYAQNSYRDVHSWAELYRRDYSLYKYIRAIYNPAYRLGEFWKAHLFGGALDTDAGDTGAIPIATDSEKLRRAIAELWKWSRWNIKKDVLSVRGTILGDAAIQIVDDVTRGRVYMSLLHPGSLNEVDIDAFGSVKGYVIREIREDPRSVASTVEYLERVSRDGDNVTYETFLNGAPYAWDCNIGRNGEAVARWSEPYGFVPLVIIQHNNVGLEWGWSELHPIRGKVQEVDGLASQISDQIRKYVDPIWLMKGMRKTSLTTSDTDRSDARPEPGREEMQAIWGVPVDGGAEAMVANLDLEDALGHISSLLKEIERDVIELSQDIHTASGNASGRALRTARQPVVAKVAQRREGYDAALVSAQQMAIAIGGWRGNDGYKGFGLDSFAKGDLDHSISARPVFAEDPLDTIEIDNEFWRAGEQAKKAGIPVEAYLREAGWDERRILDLEIKEPQSAPSVFDEQPGEGAEV